MSIYAASVDDNDPEVFYSSGDSQGWKLITSDPHNHWAGTMHSTVNVGAFAILHFTGSRITVICAIPRGSGALSQANFSIDDGPAQYASHATTPDVQFQNIFWDSGPLPMGSHVIQATNAGDEAWFKIDRFDYDPTDSNAPSSSSAPSASPTIMYVYPRLKSRPIDVRVKCSATPFIVSSTVSTFPSISASSSQITSSQPIPSGMISVSTSSLSLSATDSTMVAATSDITTVVTAPSTTSSSSGNAVKIVAGILGALLFLSLATLWLLHWRRQHFESLKSIDYRHPTDHQRSLGVPVPYLNEPSTTEFTLSHPSLNLIAPGHTYKSSYRTGDAILDFRCKLGTHGPASSLRNFNKAYPSYAQDVPPPAYTDNDSIH